MISEIKLNLSKFENNDAKNACDVIRKSRNLKTLAVSDDFEETEFCTGYFVSTAIKNCPNLRHLKIICSAIIDRDHSQNYV